MITWSQDTSRSVVCAERIVFSRGRKLKGNEVTQKQETTVPLDEATEEMDERLVQQETKELGIREIEDEGESDATPKKSRLERVLGSMKGSMKDKFKGKRARAEEALEAENNK